MVGGTTNSLVLFDTTSPEKSSPALLNPAAGLSYNNPAAVKDCICIQVSPSGHFFWRCSSMSGNVVSLILTLSHILLKTQNSKWLSHRKKNEGKVRVSCLKWNTCPTPQPSPPSYCVVSLVSDTFNGMRSEEVVARHHVSEGTKDEWDRGGKNKMWWEFAGGEKWADPWLTMSSSRLYSHISSVDWSSYVHISDSYGLGSHSWCCWMSLCLGKSVVPGCATYRHKLQMKAPAARLHTWADSRRACSAYTEDPMLFK